MKLPLYVFVLVLIAALVFAQEEQPTVGTFGCSPGLVEDPPCAAQCCGNNGGQYSFAERTCTVNSSIRWNATMSCESVMGCCKESAGNPTCSTGPALILAGLATCAMLAGYTRRTKPRQP